MFVGKVRRRASAGQRIYAYRTEESTRASVFDTLAMTLLITIIFR
jgi:hypothetical protein